MTAILWMLLGAAYPVSVIVAAKWLELVQADVPTGERFFPAGIALLGPLVLCVALAWLLAFSPRKGDPK